MPISSYCLLLNHVVYRLPADRVDWIW